MMQEMKDTQWTCGDGKKKDKCDDKLTQHEEPCKWENAISLGAYLNDKLTLNQSEPDQPAPVNRKSVNNMRKIPTVKQTREKRENKINN